MTKIYGLLKDTITQTIGPLKPTPSGYQKRNCMMCSRRGHSPDTRERFGIKFDGDSIGMNCFNCGFSAGWDGSRTLSKDFIEFLGVLGVPQKDIKKIQFELFRQKKNTADVELISIERNITSSWKEIDLPTHCYPLSFWIDEGCTDKNFLQVAQYADSRDLTNFDELYWTPETQKQLNKRLVVPFVYNGKTVGYTGRYYKNLDKKIIPKYINEMPNGFLFNLDKQIHENKYLILCEGLFDAMFLRGVSPLHNTLTKEQASIINSYDKQVILTPHRDNAGQSLIDVAMENGWAVSLPKWGRGIKDAADAVERYGRIVTMQTIIESAETNKFNIKLKRKMDKT